MDRLRSGSPVYGRQMRGDVSALSGNNSPGHRRSASVAVDGGVSGVRRTQNAAAKAAAERLAQVMASQSASDDGDDEEDGEIVTSARRYGARRPAPAAAAAARRSNGGGTGVSLLGRSARSSSPAVTASQNASVGGDDEDYEYKLSSVSSDSTSALRYYASPPATLPSSNGRVTAASLLGRSTRSPSPVSSISANENEDYEDKLSTVSSGTSTLNYTAPQPAAMASSNGGGVASSLLGRSTRSPSPALVRNLVEHTSANRSTSAGRPLVSARPTTYVSSSKMSLRTSSPTKKIDPPADVPRKKRFPVDLRETGVKYEASTLQDELDILQEENENILGKLQFAEERCEEAEARARELEKQVAALGEGVSLEARLLSRKEAALRQREADFKSAKDTRDGRDEEILMLKQEVESAKVEVATSIEQLKEAESESQDLRSFTQRMILTQEEMEEVVLKRCWLARYWGLAVQHGIYPDIAASKHELWSSLAPLPHELVISAGQKAKEESHNQGEDDSERRNKLVCDLSETGEGNIESMLSVEMGLKELASLKVEDAIVIALAQHRRPNLIQQLTSDFKAPGESKFFESFELNQEEAEDVTFKQAWLIYFWRRAKTHGAEEDIAEERLQFWIARSGQKPTSHDAIDVERGLTELRKLGIEQQLWEASRREINQTPSVTENA